MKAVRIETAGPAFDHVKVVETERPKPGPGQVLVRMRYSPINPSDHNYVHGTYADSLARLIWNKDQSTIHFNPARTEPIATPPYVLGGEGMGVVESSGGGFLANGLVGKRVAVVAGPPMGAWQEYTVVDAKRALSLPANVSDEQGSMYFINPITAWAMLHGVLKVQPGEWLLQSGSNGALGKLVIRMAKLGGFKTINIVRSAAAAKSVLALGGDIAVDVTQENLQQAVSRASGGQGVRCALDCIGGEMTAEIVSCLTRGGHAVVYGTLGGMKTELPLRDLMMPAATLSGFFLPAWLASQSLFRTVMTLRKVGKLLASGGFDTEIGATFPLAEVQQALAASRHEGKAGKVILQIGETED
jgi:NADPH:quinone reductase